MLYSIFSVLDEESYIEYDLTDIMNDGWVDEESVQNINIEKIILLTEGKSDAEFISNSLKSLYPHLSDYYHFIDFDEYKMESNASALVKLVTAFSASNVRHPIIVIFDNDTTGIMEMTKLNSVKTRSNIRILKYPDLKMAKKYPTNGPTG